MGDLFLPIIAHLRITGWREGLEPGRASAESQAPIPEPPADRSLPSRGNRG
jgi:hypothetical protein